MIRYANLPSCLTIEYKRIKERKITYYDLKSNRQIWAIKKNALEHDTTLFSKLITVLSLQIKPQNLYQLLGIINDNDDDNEIYKKLRTLEKYKHGGGTKTVCNKTQIMAEIVQTYVNKSGLEIADGKHGPYLDLGCGKCIITPIIGKAFNIPTDQIHGADIASFAEQNNWQRRPKGLTFVEIFENKPLPFTDNFFGIMTTFMVLHHIKDLDFELKEIHRVMKKGGILIVTEHDAYDANDYMLIDIHHALYMNVGPKKDEELRNYYGKYRDNFEWSAIMKKYGFRTVYKDFYYKNVKTEIRPIREYMAIYQKCPF